MKVRVSPCLGLCLLALAMVGCQRSPTPTPHPERREQLTPPQLGYALQAGAFAKVENAARLSERLQAQGLDATYFAAPDGLYKVRFGDFADRASARIRAETLIKAGVIDVFYVVPPAPTRQARETAPLREALVQTAVSFLGVPYLWGGTSPQDGFDCSGLTWAVYRLNGFQLPRHSRDQWNGGRAVEREHLQEGDLLFFATGAPGRVSHVGIYTGNGRFIHASTHGGNIREENLESGYFRDRYLGARTYL